jgi:hypothetical protein
MGFSSASGTVPPGGVFASKRQGELKPWVAGTEKQVNIVNGDDSTAAPRRNLDVLDDYTGKLW